MSLSREIIKKTLCGLVSTCQFYNMPMHIMKDIQVLFWSHTHTYTHTHTHTYSKAYYSYLSSPALFNVVSRHKWKVTIHYTKITLSQPSNALKTLTVHARAWGMAHQISATTPAKDTNQNTAHDKVHLCSKRILSKIHLRQMATQS